MPFDDCICVLSVQIGPQVLLTCPIMIVSCACVCACHHADGCRLHRYTRKPAVIAMAHLIILNSGHEQSHDEQVMKPALLCFIRTGNLRIFDVFDCVINVCKWFRYTVFDCVINVCKWFRYTHC